MVVLTTIKPFPSKLAQSREENRKQIPSGLPLSTLMSGPSSFLSPSSFSGGIVNGMTCRGPAPCPFTQQKDCRMSENTAFIEKRRKQTLKQNRKSPLLCIIEIFCCFHPAISHSQSEAEKMPPLQSTQGDAGFHSPALTWHHLQNSSAHLSLWNFISEMTRNSTVYD